jgi:hypothetical protein
MRRSLVAGLLLFAMACKGADGVAGPAGPTGPQGPQGPQGIQGPTGPGVTGVVITVAAPTVVSTVSAQLPASIPLNAAFPPLVQCYRRNPTTGSWWLVAEGVVSVNDPWCLVDIFAGRWEAVMFNVPAGWNTAFAVVW